MKICHFSSLHNRYDTRIFVKQCCSLVAKKYNVFLIVADGKGNEAKNGVTIIDVGMKGSFLHRIRTVNNKIFRAALALDADYYFYHDPELCVQAILLIKRGKKVVYDAHEDAPRQFLGNTGFSVAGRIKSLIIERLENYTAKKLFGMLTATSLIAKRFSKYNENILVVRNYPLINELAGDVLWNNRRDQGCYIGGLRNTRGITEIIAACNKANFNLKLAGPWQPISYQTELRKTYENWQFTDYLGFLDRSEIRHLLLSCKIGFLTLHKTPNHMHALPVKLFEYMCAGIPVIASDIPLWKEIIKSNDCGLCVDPTNIAEITRAINFLIDNPNKAKVMGENGKKAVAEKYNWSREFKAIEKVLDQVKLMS